MDSHPDVTGGGASSGQRLPVGFSSGFGTVGVSFRRVVAVYVRRSSTFFPTKSRRHVQQQCQQQLNYRSKGREAASVRGQCPKDQGTNLSTLTHKHGRPSQPPAEWRRQNLLKWHRLDSYTRGSSKYSSTLHSTPIAWFLTIETRGYKRKVHTAVSCLLLCNCPFWGRSLLKTVNVSYKVTCSYS